ncbi:MAG: ParB-like nuclease domain-containing protein [Sedimentisphaerales bacterium]|nr:ParB-like nuclease domain-containing protein [Sedimentisphaerales bacterium]
MANKVRAIELEKLIAHPANPNRMSEGTFAKLVRNIERTGRYEPIVVRPHPVRRKHFQIINGHHRCKALEKLGYSEADCVVWNIDDEEAGILLATLNRLCGSDELGKKLNLLRRLSKRMGARELARLLPPTAKQIERLTNLKMPSMPANINWFSNPLIFFVNDAQEKVIEKALSSVQWTGEKKTKATRRAAGLARIAEEYLTKLNIKK